MTTYLAKQSIRIEATPTAVWEALTTPAIIKQYLFGTDTISDWKKGGKITYKGTWEGKEYVDGGTILDIVPNKLFRSTYWSSMSGTEDKPENYAVVTYELQENNKHTVLTVTQDNIVSLERKEHSENNWAMVLKTMKDLLEK